MNLWRVRDFELSKKGLEYRIIYAYFPDKSTYVVLAVVEKGFDYEPSHSISRRVFNTYAAVEYSI